MQLPYVDPAPTASPAAVEIDECFADLAAWLAWAENHRSVFNAAEADAIGARILTNGFIEPLTHATIRPDAIVQHDRNWREGLVANGLNARIRAVLALIDEKIGQRAASEVRIFATEAVTPLALLLRGRFARFLGSEYGPDEQARAALFPIQHQDLTALALPDASFDLVTTNEVLEHVPDLDAALREIARVLRPGGWHVGTHPFWFMSEAGDIRATITDGKLIHLKEPEYHGNPVDPSGGSLVFETPGWNIIGRAAAAGFSTVHMRFVASECHGYITENTGVFVLCAQK